MKKLIKLISCLIMLSMMLSAADVFAAVENIEGVDYMEDVYRFDVEGAAASSDYKLNILLKLGILQSTDGKAFLTMSDYKNSVEMLRDGLPAYEEDKRKVNLRTALTGLIEALGYTIELEQASGNDSKIYSAASDIGLLKGIDMEMSEFVSNDQFKDILFNALNAEIGYGAWNMFPGPVANNTPLADVFNTIEFKGTVNAIEGINLYGTDAVQKGYVQIDRAEYLIGDTAAENYLGCRVKGYAQYSEDSDEFTILYIEQENVKNSFVLDFNDIDSVSDTRITYYNSEEKEQKVNISHVTNVVYNGQYMSNVNLSDIISLDEDGRIELQSVTGGGKYELAVVWTYRYFVVDVVDLDEEAVRLKYNAVYKGNNYIPMNSDSRIRVFMNGGEFNWNELSANNVIRVLSTHDGSYMEIDASNSSLRGTVKRVSQNDVINIGSNVYTISNDYNTYVKDPQSGLKKLESGMQGVFYISADDKIVGFKEGREYSYGYLKRIIFDEETETYKVKYMSEDGEWRTTPLSKKVVVDGEKMEAEDAGKYLVNNKNDITENIFRYKSNGVDMGNYGDSLVFIDTMINSSHESDDNGRMTHVGSFENFINFRCIYLIGSNYQLSNETVIFRVPDNLDNEDDFEIMVNTQLPWGDEDVKVPLELYNPNRYYLIGAAIYRGGEEAVGQEGFILIKGITESYDTETDEMFYEVDGVYLNGSANEERKFTVTPETAEKLSSFKVGDIHRYAVNGDKISGIMDYFSSAWTFPEPQSIARYKDYHYISGIVKDRDAENKLLVVDYGKSNIALTRIPKGVVVIDKTGSKPKVRISDYSAIRNGDKVFFYDIYGYSDWCIVMKE